MTDKAELSGEPVNAMCGYAWSEKNDSITAIVWIGVPGSADIFLEEAIKVGRPSKIHPNPCIAPEPVLKKLVDNLLGSKISEPESGSDKIGEWNSMNADCEHEEARVRATLDATVSRILSGKQTVLLDRLLVEDSFPDQYLIEDMGAGFALTGWVRDSHHFFHCIKPLRSTVAMQLALAPARKKVLAKSLSMKQDRKISEATWIETLTEVEKGWIEEDLCVKLENHLVAHRFGVDQGDEVRVIDNGKSASINSTIGLPEKDRLHDVTFVAALLVTVLGNPRSRESESLETRWT